MHDGFDHFCAFHGSCWTNYTVGQTGRLFTQQLLRYQWVLRECVTTGTFMWKRRCTGSIASAVTQQSPGKYVLRNNLTKRTMFLVPFATWDSTFCVVTVTRSNENTALGLNPTAGFSIFRFFKCYSRSEWEKKTETCIFSLNVCFEYLNYCECSLVRDLTS